MSDPEKDVVDGYMRGFSVGFLKTDSLRGKSPAFVHGFRNGAADANHRVHDRASVQRARWAMIASSSGTKGDGAS